MKQEDILRMAREAGFKIIENMICVEGWEISPYMQRFAALVAAAERKACAKVCDEVLKKDGNWTPTGHRFATAIRARNKT